MNSGVIQTMLSTVRLKTDDVLSEPFFLCVFFFFVVLATQVFKNMASGDCPQMQSDLLPHSGMFQLLHVVSSKISMNFLHLTWRIYFNIYKFITFIKNPKACIYSKNMRFSEIQTCFPSWPCLFLISAQKWIQWHSCGEGTSGISSWPSFFFFFSWRCVRCW